VIVLRPYYRNVGKRLVKTPKVYFTDVGMLCYLSGLRDPEHAANSPLSGAIIETAVLSEVVKHTMNSGGDPQVYFWRTSRGAEVDIVIEQQNKIVPVEVKQTATPRPSMASGLVSFMEDYADNVDKGWLIHLGNITLPLAPGVLAKPFAEL